MHGVDSMDTSAQELCAFTVRVGRPQSGERALWTGVNGIHRVETVPIFTRCPGAAGFAEPVPEPIRCPHCGKEVEIFTNEQFMKCYHCGGLVSRERRPSCFDWCASADKCAAEVEAQRKRR